MKQAPERLVGAKANLAKAQVLLASRAETLKAERKKQADLYHKYNDAYNTYVDLKAELDKRLAEEQKVADAKAKAEEDARLTQTSKDGKKGESHAHQQAITQKVAEQVLSNRGTRASYPASLPQTNSDSTAIYTLLGMSLLGLAGLSMKRKAEGR